MSSALGKEATTGRDADLALATGVAVSAMLAVWLPASAPLVGPVRLLVGLPLLLVVPGYAVVTALYPRARSDGQREPEPGGDGARQRALTGVERSLVAVVGSLALVGAVALAANFTPWGITGTVVAPGLAAVTLTAAAVARRRRRPVPPSQRPAPLAAAAGTAAALREEFRAETVGGLALNAVVVLALVAALGGVGYAAIEQPNAERYSEYALLSESDDDTLTATGHPSTLTAGEATPLALRVTNREGASTEYTAVVRLERVADPGTASPAVEAAELDRLSLAVADGESETVRHSVTPGLNGERLRLRYYLYAGAAPAEPSPESADETLHLWVSVVAADGG